MLVIENHMRIEFDVPSLTGKAWSTASSTISGWKELIVMPIIMQQIHMVTGMHKNK